MLKQVIVLRKDLGMRKGKMVAQGAHAALTAVLALQDQYRGAPNPDWKRWFHGEQTKVVVSVNSEAELRGLHARLCAAGLPAALVQDRGHTEFHGVPTYTALAVGPADSRELDPFTGELPLL
ncbi:aminoacyl-tRNA hydrolase [Thiomonas sp.]